MYVHRPFLDFLRGHRFVVLFVTLLVFLLVAPILHQWRDALNPAAPPLLEGFVLVLVLVGVLLSMSTSRAWTLLALGLGLPTAVLTVVHVVYDSAVLAILRSLVGMVFLGYAIAGMSVFIFTRRRVRFDTVCASLCIYLLLGAVWALGYCVIDVLDPAAFEWTVPPEGPAPRFQIGKGASTTVLYFSFATLTTLGYGDIVPVTPAARMLTIVEAITGQLYLTVLVARLVGLHMAESIDEKKKPHRRPRHESFR